MAGTVVGLSVFTEGGVIGAGQQLMEIVPSDRGLQVEARIPVELIDKVQVGLPVELLFSAFNQSTTPRVEGEVTLVGADRLTDEKKRCALLQRARQGQRSGPAALERVGDPPRDAGRRVHPHRRAFDDELPVQTADRSPSPGADGRVSMSVSPLPFAAPGAAMPLAPLPGAGAGAAPAGRGAALALARQGRAAVGAAAGGHGGDGRRTAGPGRGKKTAGRKDAAASG